MKNPLFNHDRFNTWQKCKKMYFYKYVKELKFPEFKDDYELGKSVHALIDYNLRGFKIDHLLSNAKKDVLDCWNIIKNHNIMRKKVIKTEWGFDVQIPETVCRLIGRIDAIFFDEETNKYIIADWKTGKFIPQKMHSNFQHKVYLYAFYQARKDLGLDFEPENLSFVYFKLLSDDVEPTEIKFSQEIFVEYEESFKKIIEEIENTEQVPVPETCPVKSCQYNALCLKQLHG